LLRNRSQRGARRSLGDVIADLVEHQREDAAWLDVVRDHSRRRIASVGAIDASMNWKVLIGWLLPSSNSSKSVAFRSCTGLPLRVGGDDVDRHELDAGLERWLRGVALGFGAPDRGRQQPAMTSGMTLIGR
jgi:hypothetical protein